MSIRKKYTDDIIKMGCGNCESVGFKTTNEKLGNGAYGEVKVVIGKNNERYAMKIVKIDNSTGVQNIIECYIMNNIKHPNIMKAIAIIATDSKLCIIQQIAVTDMYKYTRKNIQNHRPNLNEMFLWMNDICNAIYFMHKIGIIHGDIKSNNILLFSDNSLRITDFSLSKLKSVKKEENKMCTITHRPIECFTNGEWDEKVDIWALGCTIYEIYYGFLLFPVQLNNETSVKKQYIKKCINSIIDWGDFTSQTHEFNRTNCTDYRSYVISDQYNDMESFKINDFIKTCLILDNMKRPNINMIMDNFEYLSKSKSRNTVEHVSLRNNIDEKDFLYFDEYNLSKDVLMIAKKTYKIASSLNLTIREKIEVSIFISNKIIENNNEIKFETPRQKLIELELIICKRIRFGFDIFNELKFK